LSGRLRRGIVTSRLRVDYSPFRLFRFTCQILRQRDANDGPGGRLSDHVYNDLMAGARLRCDRAGRGVRQQVPRHAPPSEFQTPSSSIISASVISVWSGSRQRSSVQLRLHSFSSASLSASDSDAAKNSRARIARKDIFSMYPILFQCRCVFCCPLLCHCRFSSRSG
jgi:hypothetical protein